MGASERQRRFIHFSPRRCGVVTFTLADIGEGIAEVELLKLHKKLGDDVEEMEGICEVQSDKAAVEITSRYSGRIVRVHHEIGDRIKIGEAIVDIEVEDEETGGAPPSSSTPPKGGSGGGDDNKHTMSSSSPSPPPPPSSSSSKAENSGGPTRDVTASPAVRRLARELHVDLTAVQPTGKGGRVTAEDVQKFSAEAANRGGAGGSTAPSPPLDAKSANSTTTAFPSAPSSSLPPRPPKENVEVPLRGFARAMVKSMTDAVSIPHLNIGDEYDVTELLRVRALLKAEGERNYGTPLTVTPFIIKAVSLALKKFPILNSKIASSLDKYIIYGSHNISLAIDTPHGLVVPNIKDVQDLNLVEVQSELLRLQKLAAANQLSPADLTGGTFSVSNVGVISGTYVHPLLFDGQACIMGIGRTMRVPRFDAKGNVVPRDVMNCAYSADHRHCDGATVARFNAEVKRFLEEPSMMLMTMN